MLNGSERMFTYYMCLLIATSYYLMSIHAFCFRSLDSIRHLDFGAETKPVFVTWPMNLHAQTCDFKKIYTELDMKYV